MRVTFTTNWIFQGWIKNIIVILCIHNVYSKQCKSNQYPRDKKCCSKCEAGTYMFALCSGNSDTKCRPCGKNEYQPDWNTDNKCLPQRFCDTGKGFREERPQNTKSPVPCVCKEGLQCSPTNCEYCEPIPPCPPGQGFIMDESGRGICKACPEGYFSNSESIEPCRPWVSCKDSGKTEVKAGNLMSDAVCGTAVLVSPTTEVMVAILCVIIVVSLVSLTLYCYKDKIKLLSVNVRSCVQNLKRSRIQQETLAPPYNGPQHCTHEISRLLHPDEFLTLCPSTVLAIEEGPEVAPATASDSPSPSTSGPPSLGPEESSTRAQRDTGQAEAEGSTLPLSGSLSPSSSSSSSSSSSCDSCSCVISLKEPVELGENEDCSQVVSDGPTGTCSCGGGDREERVANGARRGDKERGAASGLRECTQGASAVAGASAGATPEGGGAGRVPEESPLCQNCCPEDSLQGCGECTGLQASQDLYLDYSSLPGKEAASEPCGVGDAGLSHNSPPRGTMGLLCQHNEPDSCSSETSTTTTSTTAPGALSLPSGGAIEQALSLSCSTELKLPEQNEDSEYQAHCSETALTSGQVTGNNNTTFISSGQVMNFSGEVIVVYVNQTSQGSGCGGSISGVATETREPFSCPVQEESSDGSSDVPSSLPKTQTGSTPNTLQDSNLPVQEMARRWPPGAGK